MKWSRNILSFSPTIVTPQYIHFLLLLLCLPLVRLILHLHLSLLVPFWLLCLLLSSPRQDEQVSPSQELDCKFFSFSLIEGYVSLVMDTATQRQWGLSPAHFFLFNIFVNPVCNFFFLLLPGGCAGSRPSCSSPAPAGSCGGWFESEGSRWALVRIFVFLLAHLDIMYSIETCTEQWFFFFQFVCLFFSILGFNSCYCGKLK